MSSSSSSSDTSPSSSHHSFFLLICSLTITHRRLVRGTRPLWMSAWLIRLSCFFSSSSTFLFSSSFSWVNSSAAIVRFANPSPNPDRFLSVPTSLIPHPDRTGLKVFTFLSRPPTLTVQGSRSPPLPSPTLTVQNSRSLPSSPVPPPWSFKILGPHLFLVPLLLPVPTFLPRPSRTPPPPLPPDPSFLSRPSRTPPFPDSRCQPSCPVRAARDPRPSGGAPPAAACPPRRSASAGPSSRRFGNAPPRTTLRPLPRGLPPVNTQQRVTARYVQRSCYSGLQNSWGTLQNFGTFLMKFALELKNVPFAKFTPRPLINVDHIGGGGGCFTWDWPNPGLGRNFPASLLQILFTADPASRWLGVLYPVHTN